ncbi:MAG: type II toxin-antitoxin system PemK/MazF family toxin [Treponema sp.]|nr:type II toxin-antitoxin system PemK/MazF family toxin [Treponema sp.]
MYKRGEILLIPVPFTDLSAAKKRPVLVISNDQYNTTVSHDIVVAAITSNLSQGGISINNSDMISGQLPKSSTIRCDKIYTLYQGIVVKIIGTVSNSIQNAVRKEIHQSID